MGRNSLMVSNSSNCVTVDMLTVSRTVSSERHAELEELASALNAGN